VTDPQFELLGLLADEFRAGGMPASVLPADDPAPAQLVMPIDSGQPGRHLRINSYFLPGVDHPAVLQHFVSLPYLVVPSAVLPLARYLALLNPELPVTGFEMNEHARVVVFRHTHAVNVYPLDPGVVAWTMSMVSAAVREFGGGVERVGAGADVDEVFAAARLHLDALGR
jgi:hypothetical protein